MSPASLPHGSRLLRSRSARLFALRFGWVVVVIWYEVGQFFNSLSRCRFPDSAVRPHKLRIPTSHVLLLADPHVPHPILSHPEDKKKWINQMRQNLEELFLRKSWNVVKRLGRIDAVVMLGDMLDAGREHMSDQEYEEYYGLFRSIFKLKPSTPVYYIPGNHDIPLRPNRRFSPRARQRYVEHFGKPNQVITIANHSLILLDAIGLAEEDYRRYAAEVQYGEWNAVPGGAIEFVQNLGETPPPSPILISHIPLTRPVSASCGPLREHGRISKGVGIGYQNMLGTQTSRFLLEAIKPLVVFSGDDHDYCEVTHQPMGIREVTVKTFSAEVGIKRPGFQLLSLASPDLAGEASVAYRPCLLPDGVYTHMYLPLMVLTFALLLLSNWRGGQSSSSLPENKGRHSPRPDEKRAELSTHRSSQHLPSLALSSSGPRERFPRSPVGSVPVSPIMSPRIPYAEDTVDVELGSPTSLSRRPSSHGLDSLGDVDAKFVQPQPRRLALPRMVTTSDWTSAARAKDTNVLSLVVDSAGKARTVSSAAPGLYTRVKRAIGLSRRDASHPLSEASGPGHALSHRGTWLERMWRFRHHALVRTCVDFWTVLTPAIVMCVFLNWLFWS